MHYLEAEYESGYVLKEDDLDRSPYDVEGNVFHAILNKRPEAVHGKLVRFSLVGPVNRYDIDWTTLPENSRPIRWKHMAQDLTADGPGETRLESIDFGYQYTDENGKNIQEVKEII